jgi:hypothetical protein
VKRPSQRLSESDLALLRSIRAGKRPASDDPIWKHLERLGFVYQHEHKNRAGEVEMSIWMLTPEGRAYAASPRS